jgi:peptidyl-tRNA hydrolase
LAQSCHALAAFVMEHTMLARSWHESSNNLVILECENEERLLLLAGQSAAEGVPTTLFREPDLGGAATACAFGPGARKLLSSLPLALKVPRQAA